VLCDCSGSGSSLKGGRWRRLGDWDPGNEVHCEYEPGDKVTITFLIARVDANDMLLGVILWWNVRIMQLKLRWTKCSNWAW